MNIITKLVRFFEKRSDTINPAAWFKLGFSSNKQRKLEELYYGIIFSCIDAIASAVSTNPIKLYEDDQDGIPNQIFDDPILEPLKKANRFQSGADVLYQVVSHMKIHGMSYVWARKNLLGYPIELWALDPTKITVMKSDDFDNFIRGYKYQSGSVSIPFEVEELIPIYRPHPFDPRKGVSPLEMARLEAEADLNAQDYNKAFFERGAKPSGILTTEEEISDTAWERLKKQWEEVNEDRKDSWRKTLFLENGLKYQQTSINQRDMDFIEQRKLSRDDILAIFKVPKVILAISDDVNRANAESGEYVFAKYTVLPDLITIIEKLNSFYVPLFPDSEKKFLKYDNPVPDDVKLLAEVKEKALYKWKTINEIRAEDGLEAIGKFGDKLYVPINLMPVDEEEPEDEGGDDEPTDDEKKKAARAKLPAETRALESLTVLVKAKSKEKRFLIARRKYLKNRATQMSNATRQVYTDLIREIRKAPISKAEEDSAEVFLTKIMPALDNFKSVASAVFVRYITDTFKQGLTDVNTFFEMPVNFDLVNTGATSYLRDRANFTANSLRDSMLNKARKVIADEMEKPGFTLNKAKKEVLKVFKDEADWRALRIAKTESNNAYAEANFRAYRDSGMVEKLQWIVNEPCKKCEPNAGQVVELGEAFPTGHMHEPVHPNCECETVPYFGI